jgi:hypothetical protein
MQGQTAQAQTNVGAKLIGVSFIASFAARLKITSKTNGIDGSRRRTLFAFQNTRYPEKEQAVTISGWKMTFRRIAYQGWIRVSVTRPVKGLPL